MGDTPLALADLWHQVKAALPDPWRREPVLFEPAGAAGRKSARVCKVSFRGDRALALKLAAEDAPLDGEAQVLVWLGRQGAPVPAVLAVPAERPAAWMALEWCGDSTLDDVAQAASPARLASVGRRLAGAVATVEHAFAPISERARTDLPAWQERLGALHALVAPWVEAAPAALDWLSGESSTGPARAALVATIETALAAQPDVGSLDYNAQNVVLHGPRLTLLDFAATGVDWPERRFVQYGTATGAGLAGGNFATAIGAASTRAYAEHVAGVHQASVRAVQHAVDAHDVLILLTAAQSLRAVATGAAHPERAAAWANVPERRQRLLALLRRRLVPDGPAETLRALLRRPLTRRAPPGPSGR